MLEERSVSFSSETDAEIHFCPVVKPVGIWWRYSQSRDASSGLASLSQPDCVCDVKA